jgi:hypothetical protein
LLSNNFFVALAYRSNQVKKGGFVKHFLLLTVCVNLLFAGRITVPLAISPEQVWLSNQDDFTVVQLKPPAPGLIVVATTEPGEPLLPVLSGNVLIPPDARLVAVRLKDVEWRELAQGVNIYPVQPMRPLSQFNSIPFVEPDPAIYSSDAAYPPELVIGVPAGSKAGFRIAGFLFCPFVTIRHQAGCSLRPGPNWRLSTKTTPFRRRY